MRTLSEIIEACKNGEKPDIDELRLTVCVMDAYSSLTSQALGKMAVNEKEGKRPFLVTSAVYQAEENFRRWKRALNETPLKILGDNWNPDKPEYQRMRKLAIGIWNKIEAEHKKEDL